MPAELTLDLARQDLQRFLQPVAKQNMLTQLCYDSESDNTYVCTAAAAFTSDVLAEILPAMLQCHEALGSQLQVENRQHSTERFAQFVPTKPDQPHG